MNKEIMQQTVPLNYGAVYIPNQCMTEVFEPEDGLAFGTIFPELVDEFTKYLR